MLLTQLTCSAHSAGEMSRMKRVSNKCTSAVLVNESDGQVFSCLGKASVVARGQGREEENLAKLRMKK